MFASIISVLLIVLVVANAQTACLPGRFCTNVAAIAGTYATAQACINACPAGTWASYANAGTRWCGCATSCATQVSNPDYNTFCPATPSPSLRPTAVPTATPTRVPTARPTSLNMCFPGTYCSYNMVVYPAKVASASACALTCAGQSFFTYVASTQWCACAPAGACSNRVTNPTANTYCL